ncbi:MAG: hypothetical protein HZB95_02935 [Nitrosomonadales bacterium]|nr:hypothetical protein [Nitrosomonadales bacterium]
MTHEQSGAAQPAIIRPIESGAGALVLLNAVNFGVVSLISGWNFAFDKFAKFWYCLVPLVIGFSQDGLYNTGKAHRRESITARAYCVSRRSSHSHVRWSCKYVWQGTPRQEVSNGY